MTVQPEALTGEELCTLRTARSTRVRHVKENWQPKSGVAETPRVTPCHGHVSPLVMIAVSCMFLEYHHVFLPDVFSHARQHNGWTNQGFSVSPVGW